MAPVFAPLMAKQAEAFKTLKKLEQENAMLTARLNQLEQANPAQQL